MRDLRRLIIGHYRRVLGEYVKTEGQKESAYTLWVQALFTVLEVEMTTGYCFDPPTVEVVNRSCRAESRSGRKSGDQVFKQKFEPLNVVTAVE